MAKETFTTRRNKPARRKKEQKKQGRMIEQVATGTFEDEKSKTAGFGLRLMPGGKPRYFSSSVRPRDPKRKSEITLHAIRKRETLPAPSAKGD